MLESASESETDTPSASRLVIRVTLSSEEPSPPPAPPRLNRGALLLVVGAVAVLLGWLGVHAFKSDPTPARTEAAPVVAAHPPSQPAPETTVASSTPAPVPTQPEMPPDAPTTAINEVLPDVPQSALDTIHGTVRVSVRVTIDKQGAVVEATAADRGPSRYFERLSVDASKKWTFTPANWQDQRAMLVKFNFTRTGSTAQASPVQ